MAERTYEILGPIVPYVRMTQRGKYVRRNAQRYLASKASIGWQLKQQRPLLLDGKVSVRVECRYRARGDLDNILKALLDAANGILWTDDKQIDEASITRGDGPIMRVVLHVREIEP